MRSRLVAASAITLAAALAGCSGSGAGDATSAGDSGGASSSAAPSSTKEAPASSASSEAQSSSESAPADGSEAATSSDSPSSSDSGDSPAAGAPGKKVSQTQLVEMARKVGCVNPAFRDAKPGSRGAKAGTVGGVTCTAFGKGYVFTLGKSASSVKATALGLKQLAKGSTVPYLHGDNWAVFAVSDPDAKSATFDEPALKQAQSRIGAGEISKA